MPSPITSKLLRSSGVPCHKRGDNGIKSLGIPLAPVADESGNAVNGASIYHKLPLNGTFVTKDKNGTTVEKDRAIFFASFFRKGLGFERDDVKSIYETALAAPADTDVQLTSASGEYVILEGKELMGKITVSEVNGKEYRNVKSVWPIA